MSAVPDTKHAEQFEFFYAIRSQIGSSGGVKHLECEQRTWQDVRRLLEVEILGPPTQPAAADDRSGRRRYRRDDAATLRGKVVANVYSHRHEVPANSAEWLQRAKALPHLVDRSLLESGDVLLLSRVPRTVIAREKVYGRSAADKSAPAKWQHYVRRVQTRAERDAERPRLLGRHKWVADQSGDNDRDTMDPVAPVFDDTMDEAARLQAIIDHQPYKFDCAKTRSNRWTESRADTGATVSLRERRRRGEEPPDHYVCRRCSVGGHWIQDCPTHNDRDFDRATLVPMHGMARSLFKRLEDASLLHDPEAKIFYDQLGKYYIKKTDAIDRARATGSRQFENLMQSSRVASKRAVPTATNAADKKTPPRKRLRSAHSKQV